MPYLLAELDRTPFPVLRVTKAQCEELASVLEIHAADALRWATRAAAVAGNRDTQDRNLCYALYRGIAIDAAIKLLLSLHATRGERGEGKR